jgi:hypothetical protein
MKFVLKTLPLLGTLLFSLVGYAQEAPKAPIEPKPSLRVFYKKFMFNYW